ncbi:MAG: hypothetical protein H6727_13540 [Myxococcales bacterium]|nr:hypothetical protein [Myxococcales bacterium]
MNKTIRVILLLATLPILLAIYVIFFTNIDPKKDPRYNNIKLEYKPSKTSPKMLAFLSPQKPPIYPKEASEKLHHLHTTGRTKKGWFKKLSKAQTELKKYDKVYASFLAAIQDKGCMPLGISLDKSSKNKQPPKLKHFYLILSAKLAALRTIAATQAGQPEQAAKELTEVIDLMGRMEQHCSNTLVGEMILLASFSLLIEATSYPLAQTSPALSATTRDALLSSIQKLANFSSAGLANAWIAEHQFIVHMMSSELMKSGNSDGLAGMMIWPLYDGKQIMRWQEESARHNVWLASQPFSASLPDTEWSKFTKKLEKQQSRPFSWLSYNAIGKILYSVARISPIRFNKRWHRTQCLARVQLARIRKELKLKGKPLLNPLTHKTIDPQDLGQCEDDDPKRNNIKLRSWPAPAPSVPPTTPTTPTAPTPAP